MAENYREKLRVHFESLHGKCRNITNALNFYDYCIELENAYRKLHGLSEKVLLNDKAIYDFALYFYL